MLKKASQYGAGTSERLGPLPERRDDPVLQNLIAERENKRQENISAMPPSMFVPLLVKEMMKQQNRKGSSEAHSIQQNFLSQIHAGFPSGLSSNAPSDSVGSVLVRRPSGESRQSGQDDASQHMGLIFMSGNLQAPPSSGSPHSGAATPPTPMTPSVAETPRSFAG